MNGHEDNGNCRHCGVLFTILFPTFTFSLVFGLLCMYRLEYRCKSYVRPVRVESKAVSVWTCDIQCDRPIYSKVIRLDGEMSCLTEEGVY